MNKSNLIKAFKKQDGLSRTQAAKIVELFFDEISNTLVSGDRVEIRGLCSLSVKEYCAYIGRNPRTGEPVVIKPKKLPVFKPGNELKKRVDD